MAWKGEETQAVAAAVGWTQSLYFSPMSLFNLAKNKFLHQRFRGRHPNKFETAVLASNYIWNTENKKERKESIRTLNQLSKEEKQRVAYVILALASKSSSPALFVRENLLNLYLHGSRAWGTSEETKSDWDFILVLKGMDSQDNTRLYTEFMDVNVVILTQASFQAKLNDNPLDLVPCLFLREENVWYDAGIKWEYTTHPDTICASLNYEMDRTQCKALSEVRRDLRKSKKFLLHSLRYMSFAIQLLEHGKLVDLGEVNYFWDELKKLETQHAWLDFMKEKYMPEYKRYRNKFRLLYSEAMLKNTTTTTTTTTTTPTTPTTTATTTTTTTPTTPTTTTTTTTTTTKPLSRNWRKKSEWLRYIRRLGSGWYGAEDEEEEALREKEEKSLWMSFLYPRQRTTLRMQCVDIVIETLLRECAQRRKEEKKRKEEENEGKERGEEQEIDAKKKWAQPYLNLPADLKELLWEELIARDLVLPDLRGIIGPEETEEEKKKKEEEKKKKEEERHRGFGRGRPQPRLGEE